MDRKFGPVIRKIIDRIHKIFTKNANMDRLYYDNADKFDTFPTPNKKK